MPAGFCIWCALLTLTLSNRNRRVKKNHLRFRNFILPPIPRSLIPRAIINVKDMLYFINRLRIHSGIIVFFRLYSTSGFNQTTFEKVNVYFYCNYYKRVYNSRIIKSIYRPQQLRANNLYSTIRLVRPHNTDRLLFVDKVYRALLINNWIFKYRLL